MGHVALREAHLLFRNARVYNFGMEPNTNTTTTTTTTSNPTPVTNQMPPKPATPVQPAQQKPPMQQKPQGPKAPQKNGGTLWWIIAIVIILVAIVLFASHKKAAAPEEPTTSDQSMTETDQTTKDTTATSLGYDDAIKAYAGKMISFASTQTLCTATPSKPIFVAGTRVLLNNISPMDITLSLLDTSITLKPYHYKTVMLPAAATSVAVTCNNQAAVATITVNQ